jgi:hypothetical protein
MAARVIEESEEVPPAIRYENGVPLLVALVGELLVPVHLAHQPSRVVELECVASIQCE